MSLSNYFSQNISIVSSLDVLKRDIRFDPSHYNEQADKIIRHFKNKRIETVSIGRWNNVDDVYLAPRFKRPYVADSENGVPFLGSSTMLALRLPRDVFLSKQFRKLPHLMLHGGEILLSCSGTIGVSLLCGKSYEGYAMSQHAARIYASENVRGYLHAFLSTDIGREFVLQQNYGKVIKELTAGQINNVVVPLLPEPHFTTINKLMLAAVEEYDYARGIFDSVESAIWGHMDSCIVDLEHKSNIFLKSPAELFNSRLDPHFHNPHVNLLKKVIVNNDHTVLGAVADVWMPNRFARPRAMKGYGVPFYTSSDMMRARRVPSSTVSKRAERNIEQCRVQKNDILICRSGAYGGIMGRSTFISPGADGWAVTEDMLRCRVRTNEIQPEYLFAVLSNLFVGYPMITSYRYGKDVPHIDAVEIASIPIPRFSSGVEDEISGYIEKAYVAIDKANSLERVATKLMVDRLQL